MRCLSKLIVWKFDCLESRKRLGLGKETISSGSREFWNGTCRSRLGLKGWTPRSHLGLESLGKWNASVSSGSYDLTSADIQLIYRYSIFATSNTSCVCRVYLMIFMQFVLWSKQRYTAITKSPVFWSVHGLVGWIDRYGLQTPMNSDRASMRELLLYRSVQVVRHLFYAACTLLFCRPRITVQWMNCRTSIIRRCSGSDL